MDEVYYTFLDFVDRLNDLGHSFDTLVVNATPKQFQGFLSAMAARRGVVPYGHADGCEVHISELRLSTAFGDVVIREVV